MIKSATINLDGHDQSVSCTIRDISVSGAKVTVANAGTISENLLLICRSADLAAFGTVVWRTQNEIGIHFTRRGDLSREQEFRQRQAELYQRHQETFAKESNRKPDSTFAAQQADNVLHVHFRTMGLDHTLDYTAEQLKRRYRMLAMKAHPDMGGDAVVFQRLTNAYNCLTEAASS